MGRTSDYGHGLYKQLEEVMARLDCVEKTSNKEIEQLNGRIDIFEKENADLKKENQLLLNDNARLKSIINNDSSNTSNPPSTDQKSREIATIIGGIMGMIFLVFERYIIYIPIELLRYALLSFMLIPIIEFSILIRQEKGTFLMCVVFLCVTVTHEGDISPISFAFNRIIDTTIGIVVAFIVNFLPYSYKTHR